MENDIRHKCNQLLGVIIIISLVVLTACTSSATTSSITTSPSPSPTGPSVTTVQSYADPIIRDMLVSLNNNDYAGFSKYLDQTAGSAITSTVFSKLYDQIKSLIGSYESVLFFGFSAQEPNTTVSYIAHYTDEPAGVTVTAVFQTISSTHYVHGFTLNSPKLRGQSIDVSRIRSYADPETENVLTSLNDNYYNAFSKDFNQQMKSAINQGSFNQLYTMIKTKAGYYVSKQFESITVQNSVTTVKYLAQYSNEPTGVWVIISFDSNQKVAGLFFNSPKINGQ